MVFFGTKAKTLITEAQNETPCGTCGERQSHWIGLQKYFHIYWIPFFPLKKLVYLNCGHCKGLSEEKDLNPLLAAQAQSFKKRLKTPFWTWTGLGLVICGIAASCINEGKHKKEVQASFQSPQKNDVWVFKEKQGDPEVKEFPYTFAKIVDSQGETLHIQLSKHRYQHASQITKKIVQDSDNIDPTVQWVGLDEFRNKIEVDEVFRD